MKKIYIVTAGEYSGYHIDKVFEDKDLAAKYVDAVNLSSEEYDECDIEEYEIQDTDISSDFKIADKIYFNAIFDPKTNDLKLFYIRRAQGYDKTTDITGKLYIHIEGVFEKRPNETVEQIRERGKKIAIDTYYFEKAKNDKINH